MGRPRMPLGNDIFEMLRQDGSYYIDKTGLISDLINDKDNKVTLFTRPRRFGKTLNMSMLDCFFDISRDSRKVFDGLAVSEDKELCDEYMNQYPTIFVSFKEITGLSFDSAIDMFRYQFSKLFAKFRFITEKNDPNGDDVNIFDRILKQTATQTDIKSSLDALMRMLYNYYGKHVILLIDEYDVPAAYANENGYYEQMIDVIRSMFSMALKTNPYLKFAVITGCLRITKESIFTGTNNFACYSLSECEFSKYFGFTEPEVNKLLADCELSDKADKMKEWYDGYIFGDTEVYCPWDVLNYVSALQNNENAVPKNYWRNTSHNGIIRQFVDKTEYAVTEDFEMLLNGGTVQKHIVEELTYNDVFDSAENLWTMLYMTGYLTKANKDEQGDDMVLKIPNKEIMGIFEDTVVKWFNDNIDRSKQQELMQAFWSGDEDKATELLSDFLWQTISYHDYREDYYHAFLAGMFAGIGYAVESNRESGLGRPDIILKDRRNRRALIIEAKRVPDESDLPKAADEALEQIRERQYARSIPKGYREIFCYGVAFYEKDCLVKLLKN